MTGQSNAQVLASLLAMTLRQAEKRHGETD